jgi:hypothetical protein
MRALEGEFVRDLAFASLIEITDQCDLDHRTCLQSRLRVTQKTSRFVRRQDDAAFSATASIIGRSGSQRRKHRGKMVRDSCDTSICA